jgi:gas vesicle protein
MNAKNLIGGFIAGAALGVAAGLLLAPASGTKTRKKLMTDGMKVKKNVVDYVESSIESLRSQFNRKIDQVSGRAKDTVNYAADKAESYTSAANSAATKAARNHG